MTGILLVMNSCPVPAIIHIMGQGSNYYKALENATAYKIDQQQLRLFLKKGTLLSSLEMLPLFEYFRNASSPVDGTISVTYLANKTNNLQR